MKRCLLICFVIAGFASGAVEAQTIAALRGGAYYRFADESDLTMEIKVWGAVSNPGLYEVREGMNLSTVLSLAGGPQAALQARNTASIFTVRLYRLQVGDRYQLFTETLMENQIGPLNSDPVLVQGDMVFTEAQTRQRFGWRDGLSILTAVAAIALVVDNIFFE